MSRRLICTALALAYLGVGARFGYALKVTIPAVNLAGAAYVALTWPAWLNGSPVKLPIPAWAFTFRSGS